MRQTAQGVRQSVARTETAAKGAAAARTTAEGLGGVVSCAIGVLLSSQSEGTCSSCAAALMTAIGTKDARRGEESRGQKRRSESGGVSTSIEAQLYHHIKRERPMEQMAAQRGHRRATLPFQT